MKLPSIQEMFDTIYRHFVINKSPPSIKPGTTFCMYRGPDGSKCAAGLFIPDELYNPEMENLTFTMLNSQYHLGLSLEKKQFITNMQVIHDIGASNHSETFHQYVKEQMEIYARQYDLAIPTS